MSLISNRNRSFDKFSWGSTLLGFACEKDDRKLIDFVLAEIDQNLHLQPHPYGNVEDGLQGACSGGNFDIAKLMIKKGAKNWGIAFKIAGMNRQWEMCIFIWKIAFQTICDGQEWNDDSKICSRIR